MVERFEAAARQSEKQRAEAARATTWARAEHVWVRIDYLAGTDWLPALLSGWERASDGRLMGVVQVAAMRWDRLKQEWRSSRWEQLVDADRIRQASTGKSVHGRRA